MKKEIDNFLLKKHPPKEAALIIISVLGVTFAISLLLPYFNIVMGSLFLLLAIYGNMIKRRKG